MVVFNFISIKTWVLICSRGHCQNLVFILLDRSCIHYFVPYALKTFKIMTASTLYYNSPVIIRKSGKLNHRLLTTRMIQQNKYKIVFLENDVNLGGLGLRTRRKLRQFITHENTELTKLHKNQTLMRCLSLSNKGMIVTGVE